MLIKKTKFKNLLIFQKKYFVDSRGYFLELYKDKYFKKNFHSPVYLIQKKMF